MGFFILVGKLDISRNEFWLSAFLDIFLILQFPKRLVWALNVFNVFVAFKGRQVRRDQGTKNSPWEETQMVEYIYSVTEATTLSSQLL